MSWEDFITHILATTTKVEKIVIYDLKGRPVAVTEDMETNVSEGMAVVNCLKDKAKTPTKLHLGDEMYLCTQGISNSFIGTSTRDHSNIIVAQKQGGHVVAVFGQSGGRGSFIFELKQGLLLKAQGKLITQEQIRQQHQLLPVDSNDNNIENAAQVSDTDLVDLMS